MKNNDWKDRLNVVYSTNPDFNYDMDDDQEQVTLDKSKQNLRVSLDRKSKCGVGGSAKDGEIIVQGDFKQKVIDLLIKEGYTKTKGVGG